VHELRSRLWANRHATRTEFIDGLQGMARGATHFVERSMSSVSEFRVEEAVEWQLGLFAVRGLSVTLHKQHALRLGDGGWEMRGFVGSDLDLKGRLFLGAAVGAPSGAAVELGLAATVLRDSGREAAAETVKRQVEDMVAGAQAKGSEAVQAVGKTAAAVAAGAREAVLSYTERDTYQFGDLTKTAFAKLGSAFKPPPRSSLQSQARSSLQSQAQGSLQSQAQGSLQSPAQGMTQGSSGTTTSAASATSADDNEMKGALKGHKEE
jgi:hypothetical protein